MLGKDRKNVKTNEWFIVKKLRNDRNEDEDSDNWYAPFIHCESLTDAHPSFFVPLADFHPCLGTHLIFFPSSLHPISIIGTLQHSMIPAQVQCQGCDKAFTPHGLSQHMSKTQNLCCRHINRPPLDHFHTPSIPHMVSRSSPSPNRMPDAISDVQPGDKYHGASNDGLDDVPKLGEVSSDGASFTTYVSEPRRPSRHVLRLF